MHSQVYLLTPMCKSDLIYSVKYNSALSTITIRLFAVPSAYPHHGTNDFPPPLPFFILLCGLFLHVLSSRGFTSERLACSGFVPRTGSRHVRFFSVSIGAASCAALCLAVFILWKSFFMAGEGVLTSTHALRGANGLNALVASRDGWLIALSDRACVARTGLLFP